MQGGPFEEKNFEKKSEKNVSQCRKKLKGGTLWSRPVCCYAEKQVKPFWSSSLGQMVQFDTIIFCRTFKNYFGQFVWIEKKSHYNSRVSLHEAPTKNKGVIVVKMKDFCSSGFLNQMLIKTMRFRLNFQQSLA